MADTKQPVSSELVVRDMRPAVYVFTLRAVSDALLSSGALPVPPLLEIITAYATDSAASLWCSVKASRALAVLKSNADGFELLIGSTVGVYRFESSPTERAVTPFQFSPEMANTLAIAVDPSGSRAYAVTFAAVWCIETRTRAVSQVCVRGGDHFDSALVLSADSQSLIYSESHYGGKGRLISVSVAPPHARTIIAHTPKRCIHFAWDRAAAVKPCTALYLTAGAKLERFDTATSSFAPVPFTESAAFGSQICALVCAASGHILVAETKTNGIWAVDPCDGACVRVTSVRDSEMDWLSLYSLAMAEREYAIAVSDYFRDTIHRMPLPAFLFQLKQHNAVAAGDGTSPSQ